MLANRNCVVLETNSDLFHAIPMSYGTLGFLTSITIKMIPYKPYIKLTYRPTYSLDSFVKVRKFYYNV
jgi:delta24-sterol reductase